MKINDIERVFQAIMDGDIKKIQDIIDEFNIAEGRVRLVVREYAERKFVEDKKQFEENYRFYMESRKRYFKEAMKLINLYKNGTLNTRILENVEYSKKNLEKLRSRFEDYDKIVEEINVLLDKELKRRKEKSFLSNSYFPQNKYEEEIRLVALAENPVDMIKKLNWSDREFCNKMKLFNAKHTTDEDKKLSKFLEEQYVLYVTKYKQSSMSSKTYIGNELYHLEAKKLIDDILASGMSIAEYCHSNINNSFIDITKSIYSLYGKEKGKELILKINERQNPYFQTVIDNICLQIIENPNFTIIDYYLLTKLNLNDFKSFIDIRMNGYTKIAKFIGKYNDRSFSRLVGFNQERALNEERIIKGVYIKEEEKKYIFKYLDENHIPLDLYTYNACLDKVASGEGFKDKIKTKGSF